MKRTAWLILFLLVATFASAQTQQGIVKTRGRMVNGVHIPGQGLAGATVIVKGRSAIGVQNVNGKFSFPVTDGTFVVTSVSKKGYQLVDADAVPRQYIRSSSPIYFVMETPEEKLQDKLDAERKIRRTLQRRLEAQENEIESRKISLQEKHQLFEQLYQQQEGDERLIAEMARRYAEMDYDQLDETNRRISDAIIDGRLAEADSLLKAKGDLQTRISEVRKAQVAEIRESEELERRKDNLLRSQAGTRAKLQDVGQDCCTRYELFKMMHQMDSAAIYLIFRTELDTTNAFWQRDVALFYFNFLSRTDQAVEYAQHALRLAEAQQAEELQAELHMLLGDIYDSERKMTDALDHYRNGASIVYHRYGENHPIVAEYLYQSFPHIYFYSVGFLLKTYIYQRVKTLSEGLVLEGDTVNPWKCISIWENALQHPAAGVDSCFILRRLGEANFYINYDQAAAKKYFIRAKDAYEQRDGRHSLEVGRMYYCMGNCNYSLLKELVREQDQKGFRHQLEESYGVWALVDFAESADILCTVVSPHHREVRQVLKSLRNVYEELRNTSSNADSLFAEAHPLLNIYQRELHQLQAWDNVQQLDTATTDKGRQEQALVNVWNSRVLENKRLSAWIRVWKKAHPDDNRFPMPQIQYSKRSLHEGVAPQPSLTPRGPCGVEHFLIPTRIIRKCLTVNGDSY